MLDFRAGQLFVSTQLARAQRLRIFGDQGSIEVQVPVNAPDDRPTHIVVDDGRDAVGAGAETFEFPPENQYTLQGEAVSRMIREGLPPAMPLEQSVANMRT